MTAVLSGTVRLGTRRSPLAMTQAGTVAAALRAAGHDVEIVEVVTAGDRLPGAIAELGGTGVFVTALREQLRAGSIDVAVHSLKDLPTAAAPGLVVAACPRRADPRDALVARHRLDELPAGSRVGTGSPRRTAQLRALGLGLDVVPVRGNVDTRLRLVADGTVDAVIVAAAGLARLSRLDAASELLDPGQMLPAAGQGALAVECRAADAALASTLAETLDDSATRAAVEAERALLAALEAGCTAPVGALADLAVGDDGDEIYLRAVALATDGTRAVRMSATGPADQPAEVGRSLATRMLEAGVADLIVENP